MPKLPVCDVMRRQQFRRAGRQNYQGASNTAHIAIVAIANGRL